MIESTVAASSGSETSSLMREDGREVSAWASRSISSAVDMLCSFRRRQWLPPREIKARGI